MTAQIETYNFVDTPLLIVNKETGEATPNIRFKKTFGNISHFEEMNTYFFVPDKLSYKDVRHDVYRWYCKQDMKYLARLSCQFSDVNTIIITITTEDVAIENIFLDYKFQKLLKYLNMGVAIFVQDENKAWATDLFISHAGGSTEEISLEAWYGKTYKDDVEMEQKIIEKTISSSTEMCNYSKRINSNNGKITWLEETHLFFETIHGPTEMILFFDITKEKSIEKELNTAIHHLENSDSLKNAFLNNLPHEIRTPLHAISGFADLLSIPGLETQEKFQYITYIKESCNSILSLINNIVDVSRLEANEMKVTFGKCRLKNLFSSIHSEIDKKQRELEKEHLNVQFIEDNSIPDLTIHTDEDKLKQLILQLVYNALKFTNEGHVQFGYSIDNDSKKVHFFVRDTGIGIKKEDQENIFKKFVKGDGQNTDRNRGAGLGLTLTNKLIKLLGSEIYIDSTPNEGSTFYFDLSIDNTLQNNIQNTNVKISSLNWWDKNILIAEDTESNYIFIEAFLEKTNAKLYWAKTGLEALNLVKSGQKFDVVLMDVMMPEMDGYEATAKIKTIDPELPIIIQTALALPDEEEKCYENGCDHVLVKPISSEKLIATIKHYFLQ